MGTKRMFCVYTFPQEWTQPVTFEMPRNWERIALINMRERVCLIVAADPAEPRMPQTFKWCSNEFDEAEIESIVGTVVMADGQFWAVLAKLPDEVAVS